MKKKKDIKVWLYNKNITDYKIHKDFSVSCFQDVDLRYHNLTHLPVEFNIIEGNFNCSNNKLTTLKWAPKIIHGDFNVNYNNLTSLKYSPHKVFGSFSCAYNRIKHISVKLQIEKDLIITYNFLKKISLREVNHIHAQKIYFTLIEENHAFKKHLNQGRIEILRDDVEKILKALELYKKLNNELLTNNYITGIKKL